MVKKIQGAISYHYCSTIPFLLSFMENKLSNLVFEKWSLNSLVPIEILQDHDLKVRDATSTAVKCKAVVIFLDDLLVSLC